MIARVTLLLFFVALATCSRAERVRVEFEASLVDADPAFVDPASSLRGHYAFDTSTVQSAESAVSSLTFANLSEFVLSGVSAVLPLNEGLATRLHVALPPDAINRSAQAGSALSVWSVQVGLVSNSETRNSDSPADSAQRLADDLNGNGNSGQVVVLADIDGDGIAEPDEVVGHIVDFGGLFQFNSGFDFPVVLQPEAVLNFTLDQSVEAISDNQLAPPALEDLSSATLRVFHREFGSVSNDPLRPTLGVITLELEYEITSLRVVTVPEPQSLLLVAGVLGIAFLPRSRRS